MGRFLVAAALSCCAVAVAAQERPRSVGQSSRRASPPAAEEALRVRTRAVFIDTLVRDKKTNAPVRGLSREDFLVFDDGRPRELTYFTREGDSRRPLAMLLFVDLWSVYGRSHLKSREAMRRMASALSKLSPEDEVAVMTTWVEDGGADADPRPVCRLVEGFTRDRVKAAAALASLPELIRQQERLLEEIAERRSADAGDLRLDIYWRLLDVAAQVLPLFDEKPGSQPVVVGLIDDLFDLRKGEREDAVAFAHRAGITFNGLIFKKSLATRFFLGSLNKLIMKPRGLSVHAAEYLARETGGEVAGVGKPDDLAAGLERFIASLSARYNLGFSLAEHEEGDGRVHALEVQVRARAARGKRRELEVRARRGYYLPEGQ